MRLTRLVRSTPLLTGAAILAAAVAGHSGRTHRTPTPVLNLAKAVPRDQRPTSGWMPGAHIGGVGGVGLVPRPYSLPLAVKLISISPRQLGPRTRLSVELVLKNMGTDPYYLPASLKRVTVLKQGNKGRRTLLFSLVLEDVKRHDRLSFGVGSSDGSETIPSSFLRLAPGQAVRVLLAGGLNSLNQQQAMSQWLAEGVKEVWARAKISEWRYEDKRYFIENEAQPVTSGNALRLRLSAP